MVPKSVGKLGENAPLAFVQHLPLKGDFALEFQLGLATAFSRNGEQTALLRHQF